MGWNKRRGHNCTDRRESTEGLTLTGAESFSRAVGGELGHVKLVYVAEKKEISVLGASGTLVIYHTE